MAVKKSELYSSIWQSCHELRGGMDASQYKDYVLVLLFVKYVSDKYSGQPGALLDVPKGGSFADMVALKGDKDIGDKINKIIGKLAEKNELKGVIDVADFNDADKLGKGKEMVDCLSNLVSIFDTPALDFRSNRAEGDDLLGDAYEYLMRKFATESGKSKGQFYTPAEVSRIMAKVIGVGSAKSPTQTIYDPTCGSGSLLLKAHDEAKGLAGLDLAIYGQEMDNATAALAKMNMILHDCPSAAPDIWKDNTLAHPHHKEKDGSLKRFDFVVANPPFSTKAWSNGFDPANDLFRRFEYGVPPKKNGDYAFLLHILASLKSNGKGAVILPHGALSRGNAEADIRKEVVRRGYVKGIIGLPANLFYGTGIPACIVVLDKENSGARKGIFMIDASKGYIKDGNKNRLRAQDIHRIVDTFTRQIEIPRYSRMVPQAEISNPQNDFHLNLPRYIDSTEPEDLQDIDAHLCGGIPNRDISALERYWHVIPAVRPLLFESAGRADYSRLKLPATDLKTAIFNHKEFTAFNASITALFAKWKAANYPNLNSIKRGDSPKALIAMLSESLLAIFGKSPLIDPYDVYQHLMDYWAATMQDDVYLIAHADWCEAAKPRLIIESTEQKSKEEPDFMVRKQKFKSDLIPAALLIAHSFSAEQAAIDALKTEIGTLEQMQDELQEEHGGEEGLLEEIVDEKGKISKKAVVMRLKEIAEDKETVDECKVLKDYAALLKKEAEMMGQLRAAEEDLEAKVAAKYGKLTETEIKRLVVDGKWLAALAGDVQSELDRVSQALTGRVQQLAERYAVPLPKLTEDVKSIMARVDEHLKQQLLTGKKRLPGFTGQWQMRKLGDLLKYERPDRYIVKSSEYVDRGAIPVLTANKSFILGYTNEEFGIYSNLPAIIFDDFTTDSKLVDFPFKVKSSAIKILKCRTGKDSLKFIHGRMRLIDFSLGDHKRYYISEYQHLEIAVPEPKEQIAIAAVLSDMDAGIAALDVQLAKIRALKQGMMQELLMGRPI